MGSYLDLVQSSCFDTTIMTTPTPAQIRCQPRERERERGKMLLFKLLNNRLPTFETLSRQQWQAADHLFSFPFIATESYSVERKFY